MTEAILRDHEEDLSDGMRQDVTLIDGAMVEALELVNDHLDLAKLAAGRTIVRLSDVDVPELFADAPRRRDPPARPSRRRAALRRGRGRARPSARTASSSRRSCATSSSTP